MTAVARRHVAPGPAPLAVGDSTMLLSLTALADAGYDVSAMGCRQFFQGLALLSSLKAAGRLPHLVVFALGANGQVTQADIDQALALLGPQRTFVLVTHYEPGHVTDTDLVLERHDAAIHRIHLLDWVAASSGHPAWFQPDGLHLTLAGAAAFARLLERALRLAKPAPRAPPAGEAGRPREGGRGRRADPVAGGRRAEPTTASASSLSCRRRSDGYRRPARARRRRSRSARTADAAIASR